MPSQFHDCVGLGKSDVGAFDSGRYATLDGYAQDLVEIAEALDLRGATIVGHSVSSMTVEAMRPFLDRRLAA